MLSAERRTSIRRVLHFATVLFLAYFLLAFFVAAVIAIDGPGYLLDTLGFQLLVSSLAVTILSLVAAWALSWLKWCYAACVAMFIPLVWIAPLISSLWVARLHLYLWSH